MSGAPGAGAARRTPALLARNERDRSPPVDGPRKVLADLRSDTCQTVARAGHLVEERLAGVRIGRQLAEAQRLQVGREMVSLPEIAADRGMAGEEPRSRRAAGDLLLGEPRDAANHVQNPP